MRLLLWITLLIAFLPTALAGETSFPLPENSQDDGEQLPAAEDTPALFTLPDRFDVTLHAGEPAVRQPIVFQIDECGARWVAEN